MSDSPQSLPTHVELVRGVFYAAARTLVGLSQRDLAKELYLNMQDIVNLETGLDTRPELFTIVRGALSRAGIMMAFDEKLGLCSISTSFKTHNL